MNWFLDSIAKRAARHLLLMAYEENCSLRWWGEGGRNKALQKLLRHHIKEAALHWFYEENNREALIKQITGDVKDYVVDVLNKESISVVNTQVDQRIRQKLEGEAFIDDIVSRIKKKQLRR